MPEPAEWPPPKAYHVFGLGLKIGYLSAPSLKFCTRSERRRFWSWDFLLVLPNLLSGSVAKVYHMLGPRLKCKNLLDKFYTESSSLQIYRDLWLPSSLCGRRLHFRSTQLYENEMGEVLTMEWNALLGTLHTLCTFANKSQQYRPNVTVEGYAFINAKSSGWTWPTATGQVKLDLHSGSHRF